MTLQPLAISASIRDTLRAKAPKGAIGAPEKGAYALADNGDGDVELLIYGNIGDYWWDEESVSARSVVEMLKGLSPSTITVRINSYGGIVNDGIAIHNELRRHAARGAVIDVVVDGVAYSIASLIAMAGTRVKMYDNALMMLHAPWGTLYIDGNAKAVMEAAEEFAAVLRTMGKSMSQSYARRTGKPAAEFEAMWESGKDYLFTAADAKEFGLCDEIIDDPATADSPAAATAAGRRIAQALAAAAPHERTQILASLRGAREAHPELWASARKPRPAPAGEPSGDTLMPNGTDPSQAGNSQPAAPAANAAANALAALRDRNTEIQALAALHPQNAAVQAYVLDVIAAADPAVTPGDVGKQILQLLAKDRAPVNPGGSLVQGQDETDNVRQAATQIILARAGALKHDEAVKARDGNPFNGLTLMEMARECAARAGTNVRGLDTERIYAAAMQTTSDFPVIFENALHKLMLQQFFAGEQTWRTFCKVGTLSDFRPHIRIFGSTFSDLDVVSESGEYKDGNYPDGEKQSIAARSKGRILSLSYEAIKNDDVGFFADAAQGMGNAAIRTLNKDVFAMLAANSGNGPTMADGNPLFHASHNNIATAADSPTVTSVDAAKQLMAKQKAPGGNDDYLDIRPAIWLGPLELGGAARVVNNDQYDPDASNKLQRTNIARNAYRDIIDTPRAPSTAWYSFADPNLSPVFEVGFVDGIQVPRLVMQEMFRSNGVSWRVTYDYGVGAVGFRGAVKTPRS